MSTESDRHVSSSENEAPKRPQISYEDQERRVRPMEEPQMRYHPSMSPPPHPIMYRHPMDPQMMRPHPRSISPHIMHTEDSDLTDAMIFLNRIKDEYSDNMVVYDNFLETMRDFRFEKLDAEEVCKAVRILFKEKPYLIRLFDEYLPHHLRHGEPNRGYEMPERPKNIPYRGPGFMNKPPTPIHMGQMSQMPPNSAIHMNRISHPLNHPAFMRPTMRQSPPPMLMPQEQMPRYGHPIPHPPSPRHRTAEEFVQQVKKRYLSKPLVYRQFVELLQNSKNSFEKLYTQVSALLSDSPDLVEKFERNFKTTQPQTGPSYNPEVDPLRKIKQKLAEHGSLEQFLRIINFYNQNYLSANDLLTLIEPLVNDQESIDALKGFLRYSDTQSGDKADFKSLEKVGSYRILSSNIQINTSTPLSKEVLNSSCICVSTHDSEDDTYVFRPKNRSEEILGRISDERSEADLMLDRLRLMIGKFQETYESVEEGVGIVIEDIQISPSLLKEALCFVYESKSTEILDAILANPKKAIPIVLRRLNKVYRENLERIRALRKFWRNVMEEHYYEAYDTRGVFHRSQEKNYLSLRYLYSDASTTKMFTLGSFDSLTLIRDLFIVFIKAHPSNTFRKQSYEAVVNALTSVIENLAKDNFSETVKFDTYALYYYVLLLYTRFEEIKKLTLPTITSNPVAVAVNLQIETNIENRYGEVIKSAMELMEKVIDADRFEDVVRRMTNCMGYKIYNLKKIISKIEKQINAMLDGDEEQASEERDDDSEYLIKKNEKGVIICRVDGNNKL